MNKKFSNFKNRTERAVFITKEFDDEIKKSGSILDVGCSDNELKKLIGNKVYGIDIAGKPDRFMDLEKEGLKSFGDNSFDLVVCTEVLEHVDNFYEIIDELHRVSKKHILISLPNCTHFLQMAKLMFTGNTGKFYGLPDIKPEDRHKWFFSWNEADGFFENYCVKKGGRIEKKFLNFNLSGNLASKILGSFARIFPLNSFSNDFWILIKK